MVTIHGAPHGRKAYIQWGVAWFHKGIVYSTAIAAFSMISSNLVWVDHSPVSQH